MLAIEAITRQIVTRLFGLLIFSVLCCAGAFGQIKSGTIVGTVTDPSGAVVPGAGAVAGGAAGRSTIASRAAGV